LIPKPELHPKQVMHAPTLDPATNFIGWIWSAMPYWVVKAARHGAVINQKIVGKVECVECKRWMWTCDMQRENTCEECDYILHARNRELQKTHGRARGGILINPFGSV
jgi:hypothetical protein